MTKTYLQPGSPPTPHLSYHSSTNLPHPQETPPNLDSKQATYCSTISKSTKQLSHIQNYQNASLNHFHHCQPYLLRHRRACWVWYLSSRVCVRCYGLLWSCWSCVGGNGWAWSCASCARVQRCIWNVLGSLCGGFAPSDTLRDKVVLYELVSVLGMVLWGLQLMH